MSTPQQFSLRWNNYLHHITSAFDNLRDEDDFIDCTLSCDGKKIKAHKMLLSACSSYFREIFKENPCQHPVIILKGVTYYDLEALVDFMYNGEVNVNQEQLGSFLNTAELLQVRGLTDGADKGVNQQGTNSNSGQAQATSVPTSQDVKKVIDSNSASAPTPSPRSSHPSTPLTDPPPAKRKRQTPSVVAIATADHSEHSMSSSSRSPAMPSAPSISHVEASGSSTEMDASAPVIEPIDIPLKMEEPEYADENDDDNVAFIDDDDEDLDDDLSGHNDSDLKLSSELTIEPTAGPSNLSMLSKPGTSGEGNSQEPVHDVTYQPSFLDCTLFACTICGKTFQHMGSVASHQQLHRGVTTCPVCGKIFSRTANMWRHITSVHQEWSDSDIGQEEYLKYQRTNKKSV